MKKGGAGAQSTGALESDNFQSTNIAAGSQIAQLQDAGDTYARKIEIEQKRIKDLDRQIADVQEQIKHQRAELHGSQGAKETNDQVAKRIRSLENKLDKALQKYNEQVAHNKVLREQINTLRRERKVYNEIYEKLENELNMKKTEMDQIVKKGKEANEEMQNIKRKIAQLKEDSAEEQVKFQKQWKDLTDLIKKDKRIKDVIKQRDPTNQGEEQPNALLNEEQALKKKVARAGWGIAKDKASIHTSMQKVQTYEEAFSKIQQATGITDIDELVKTFVEAEKHNFSLFNYVNELSNEMERLETQISSVKQEIEKYQEQGGSSDNQRKRIMNELEDKLAKTENKASHYEDRYQRTMNIINSLKVGIQSIFDRIGCNTETVQEMLGFSGVTEANMMQYLGIIEQRTNEILQMYSACQAQSVDTNALFGHTAMQQNVQEREKAKVEYPDYDSNGEEESDDDMDVPMDKRELMNRAQKNASKKADTKQTKGFIFKTKK